MEGYWCDSVLRGTTHYVVSMMLPSQVIGPLSPSETFLPADFAMLHQFESSSHGAALLQAMEDIKVESLDPDDDTVQFRSELLMKVASLLRSQPKKRRLSQLPQLDSNHRYNVYMRVMTEHTFTHYSLSTFYAVWSVSRARKES